MINFLFCIVLPAGASKVDQTHKLDNFLDLTHSVTFDWTVF